jgi:DNA polymerase-3 subunit beta
VHDDLLSIGALARAGGLPVTALRFYDAAGVLRPAHVDPVTGYRWYNTTQVHTARLVASLRQAGLPVAELLAVLAAPNEAESILDHHRRRLEMDLAAAGEHLDAATEILSRPGRCTVAAADFVAALRSVRHAVGADEDWPALAGVLLHLDGHTLRLVGCDRYRLAVATVPVRQHAGPQARVVAPLGLLDEITSATTLPDEGQLVLGAKTLEVLGFRGDPVDARYPNYERILGAATAHSLTVESETLIEAVGEAGDAVVVRLDGEHVDLVSPSPPDTLAFSRTFVLDAVRAAHAEHVALALDDERSALSISPAGRPHDVSLVMPIRLRT